ncbi:MAG: DNA polymerase I [Anaerolineaceae bacterium]|nr:DNA polymerase I [Anaerolineaceae bacterium]
MSTRPQFYIIDGHALAYRQFHALASSGFRTRAGEPTNATYGFTRTLLDILLKDKPDYLAVSFDRGLSGREELFEDYKGTRDKMPDDLAIQIERIYQVVETFNIPVLAMDGYEADDIVGTTVKIAETLDVDSRIITGDKDMLQLLTPHVTAQLPKRGTADVVYDMALFREEFGLEPWQLVELKGLMGDSSDNIPGIKGVGQKTATKLLQDYETIEGIYAHIDEQKGALKQKLIDGEKMAYLSRELATIRRDIPVEFALEKCVAHDFNANTVLELFRELEFRQFSDRLAPQEQLSMFAPEEEEAAPAPVHEDIGVETIIVRDEAALNAMVDKLNQAAAIVWDVETTGIDQMACELVGIALAVDGDTGYYVPVGHSKGEGMFVEPVEQLPLRTVMEALRAPLTNPNIPKYAHNAEYDLVVTQRYGIDVRPVTFDTMIAEWLRDPTSKFLGLKNFSNQYLKIRMTEISELIGTGKKQITMDKVDVDQAAPYAAADAAITYRAAEYLRPPLEADPDLWRLFNTLEMPLVPVIAAMERAGVVLDTEHLSNLSQRLDGELQALEKRVFELTDGYGAFNINSPKQLNEVLFDKLGLSVEGLRKTSHGYSTNAATLESLKAAHPIIKLILEYRELTKLKGTYVDALPALINPDTGRLHTSYNQAGTATGRLSSSNPNLQNIPIRTEQGREVRRAFIPAPGSLLLAVDYSQIELRVLAHYSDDPTLLEAFANDQDIHAATAAAVYGIPLADVTYDQRSFAKRVNFGLIYGMGAFRLARDSDLSLSESRQFIDDYFARLPKVKEYLDNTKMQAREGALTTLFGRRREFRALMNSTDSRSNEVQAEERMAINMPIQGTAADIMKKAMIDLYNALNKSHLDAQMILQVHDELVLEVPEDEIDETARLVVDVMEHTYELKAPLKANAEIGPNWRDMEPVPH